MFLKTYFITVAHATISVNNCVCKKRLNLAQPGKYIQVIRVMENNTQNPIQTWWGFSLFI